MKMPRSSSSIRFFMVALLFVFACKPNLANWFAKISKICRSGALTPPKLPRPLMLKDAASVVSSTNTLKPLTRRPRH